MAEDGNGGTTDESRRPPRRAATNRFYEQLGNCTKRSRPEETNSVSPAKVKRSNFMSTPSTSTQSLAKKRILPPRPIVRTVQPKEDFLKCFAGVIEPKLTLDEINIARHDVDPQLRHRCELCYHRLECAAQLTDHLSKHVENMRSCSLCHTGEDAPMCVQEFSEHIAMHFITDQRHHVCIFCEAHFIVGQHAELIQHLFYSCPKASVCMICAEQLGEDEAVPHRTEQHVRLLNRFICSHCFTGFPSLAYFVRHECHVKYRCLCNLSIHFEDVDDINSHLYSVAEENNGETTGHGSLLPSTGMKRTYFLNPHAIAVDPDGEEPLTNFGFCGVPTWTPVLYKHLPPRNKRPSNLARVPLANWQPRSSAGIRVIQPVIRSPAAQPAPAIHSIRLRPLNVRPPVFSMNSVSRVGMPVMVPRTPNMRSRFPVTMPGVRMFSPNGRIRWTQPASRMARPVIRLLKPTAEAAAKP